jgi:hypothetical protein
MDSKRLLQYRMLFLFLTYYCFYSIVLLLPIVSNNYNLVQIKP